MSSMEQLALAPMTRTPAQIRRAAVPAVGSWAPGFVRRPSNLSGIRFKDRVAAGHRRENTRACAGHLASVRVVSCASPIKICSAPRAWCPATWSLMAARAPRGPSAIPQRDIARNVRRIATARTLAPSSAPRRGPASSVSRIRIASESHQEAAVFRTPAVARRAPIAHGAEFGATAARRCSRALVWNATSTKTAKTLFGRSVSALSAESAALPIPTALRSNRFASESMGAAWSATIRSAFRARIRRSPAAPGICSVSPPTRRISKGAAERGVCGQSPTRALGEQAAPKGVSSPLRRFLEPGDTQEEPGKRWRRRRPPAEKAPKFDDGDGPNSSGARWTRKDSRGPGSRENWEFPESAGALCTAAGPAPGASANGLQCHAYCSSDSDCAATATSGAQFCMKFGAGCVGDPICDGKVPGGVCAHRCTQFGADCDSATTCGMVTKDVDGTRVLVCRSIGGGTVGSACEFQDDCGENTYCDVASPGANSTCLQLCDASGHACATGTALCSVKSQMTRSERRRLRRSEKASDDRAARRPEQANQRRLRALVRQCHDHRLPDHQR